MENPSMLERLASRLDALEDENSALRAELAAVSGRLAGLEVGTVQASSSAFGTTSRRGLLRASLGVAAATVGAGGILGARTAAASTETPAAVGQVTVANVKAFGAKGTGRDDDHDACQAAINSLGVRGGVVYFPAGTYQIGKPSPDNKPPAYSQPLIVPSNVSLLGAGRGATILTLPNYVRQDPPGQTVLTALVVVNRANTWWTGSRAAPADTNLSLAHMTFDGNKTRQHPVSTDTAAGAIYLDNAADVYLHDLEVRNFGQDGITISSSFSGYLAGQDSPPILVQRCLTEAIWSHDNARTGLSITGMAQAIRFVDCWIENNSPGGGGGAGIDIEPPGTIGALRDIQFTRCRFLGNAFGLSIAPRKASPIDNLSLTDCEFDGNLWAIEASSDIGLLTNFHIAGCTFRSSRYYACTVWSPGFGSIVGCDFEGNSTPPLTEEPLVLFRNNAYGWRVIGNNFLPNPQFQAAAIAIQGGCTGFVIIGNHYFNAAKDPPIQQGGIRPFVEADNLLTGGHVVHSNTGNGDVFDSGSGHVVGNAIGLAVPLDALTTYRGNTPIKEEQPSVNIVFDVPLATARYLVSVTLGWNKTATTPADWEIANQTKAGFTIVLHTPPVGAFAVDYLNWSIVPT